MKPQPSNSTLENIFKWIFTVVAVFLFVRLIIFILRIIFNFSETPVGRVMQEGNFWEKITNMSPRNIIVQAAIIVVVVTFYFISKEDKKED